MINKVTAHQPAQKKQSFGVGLKVHDFGKVVTTIPQEEELQHYAALAKRIEKGDFYPLQITNYKTDTDTGDEFVLMSKDGEYLVDGISDNQPDGYLELARDKKEGLHFDNEESGPVKKAFSKITKLLDDILNTVEKE